MAHQAGSLCSHSGLAYDIVCDVCFAFHACSEETPDAPVATEPAAPAPGEPMDVNSAVKLVLKKALAHDGLARGLRETTRAIEKDTAQVCILADDCDQPDYKKLIEALCAEKNVHLLSVPEAKQLGQWAGVRPFPNCLRSLNAVIMSHLRLQNTDSGALMQLCKIDQEGEARKVVGCSSVVVTVSHLCLTCFLWCAPVCFGLHLAACNGPVREWNLHEQS